ncbi:MAG: hypothetical protein GX927_06595 [Lentisphaerae bacterium]|jgi:hypothetical protein|nr:hypothetical protein [Lentisphaerota bacterium]
MDLEREGKLSSSERGWRIQGSGLELEISRADGCVAQLSVLRDQAKVWTPDAGDVTVRDDRMQRCFGKKDLAHVDFSTSDKELRIRKSFHGAPWTLEERYCCDGALLTWSAELSMESGEYRSCAISWNLPWPQPSYPISFWAARENMPSAPHRFAELALEYGEITSGILIPALCSYWSDQDIGLLISMPFDFRTPRMRFRSGHRELDLRTEFDWLALEPGKPAKAKLLLHGTPGDWRPALGWLYQLYTEYFEPRSHQIAQLWGGHISGEFNVSDDDARIMAALGMKWHEIHAHFPAYGNYHPEGMESWRSGHARKNPTMISVEMIKKTISTLHKHQIAAMPYLQVSGDGDVEKLDPAMISSRLRDRRGEYFSAWPGTVLMNSDPSLPFGADITRQIRGMIERYPDIDGIFLDQPCYNFLDTAHSDGITAVDNRPAYMSGFNYFPHLELLSKLLHPNKSIIGNAPFGIGIMKYIDGFMAEGSSWLCDHLQYYALGSKPQFFLMYKYDDASLEMMFQKALLYGAGFASYPAALPSKDLFDAYCPVLQKLFRRRWIFDPNPLQLPATMQGHIYRGETGSLLVSLVRTMARLPRSGQQDGSIRIATSDSQQIRKAILHCPAVLPKELSIAREQDAIQVGIPPEMTAGVLELTF